VHCDGCPKGVIAAESLALLEMDARNRRVKEATGACLFGPDAGRWPAWWVDAVTVIQTQVLLEMEARSKAV